MKGKSESNDNQMNEERKEKNKERKIRFKQLMKEIRKFWKQKNKSNNHAKFENIVHSSSCSSSHDQN